MTTSSTTLHENEESLSSQEIDRHRAIVSLMEELEAVDWYGQRAAAASDPELKKLLLHNRDEELEHAAMLLEWLRRGLPEMDRQLRVYLFKEEAPSEVEPQGASDDIATEGDAPEVQGSLGIGSLR